MSYRIQFGDLRIDDRARGHLLDTINRNWVSEGPKVKELEAGWKKLFGYEYNIAMSSGTSADIAACMTLYDFGAKRGDEVIVPALAFAAVGNSVLAAGLTPRFVDIEKDTMNINPYKIEEKINNKTKAIMAVHTMGKPCEMDVICDIAGRHGLKVIEDCCEAHGARYKGKMVGHWGDVATFSAYVAHLICCGEGGMSSTNNEEIANLLRSVKSHGRRPGSIYFNHERHGLNFKMNDLEAAIGLPQVEDFWNTFQKRKDNIKYLLNKSEDLKEFAIFNLEEENDVNCPHAFSLILRNPRYNIGDLYSFLEDGNKGIMCKRNFGSMPTQHKAFEFMGYNLGNFPEAEYVGDNGLHFGCHQHLTKDDLDYTSERLHEYFERF